MAAKVKVKAVQKDGPVSFTTREGETKEFTVENHVLTLSADDAEILVNYGGGDYTYATEKDTPET